MPYQHLEGLPREGQWLPVVIEKASFGFTPDCARITGTVIVSTNADDPNMGGIIHVIFNQEREIQKSFSFSGRSNRGQGKESDGSIRRATFSFDENSFGAKDMTVDVIVTGIGSLHKYAEPQSIKLHCTPKKEEPKKTSRYFIILPIAIILIVGIIILRRRK